MALFNSRETWLVLADLKPFCNLEDLTKRTQGSPQPNWASRTKG